MRRSGGDGIERDLEVLEDATVSLITERRVSHPWGADGGEAGRVWRELAAARAATSHERFRSPTSARCECVPGT